ncbi:GNAT family N-acetyltransferase [Hymenobacter convexus]|uniref:GNAT family N-acetyltransferase n=1 Tax=Hymenobacter sp. CA1UV-4 TaxID=3063782 RepID=UPI002712A099|nr:GNAT family N-acetyltransferase [Hymenobacter sp. CA1UV-4]MDO7854306.1 GNAT family N-acetyltransferase [Hymenobacter sp. CA1UV-4]
MAPPIALPARRLDAADLSWATLLLTDACADHPVLRYCCSEPDAPAQRTWLMEQLLRFGMRFGRVYTNATSTALAIWVRPGQSVANGWQLLQSGFLPAALWRLPGKSWLRLRQHLGAAARLRRASGAAACHHHLLALAVSPLHRGQGQGRRLLQATLAAMQATHAPCYLDTQVPEQLPFYQRIGFRLTGQCPASAGTDTPLMWGLVREASQQSMR